MQYGQQGQPGSFANRVNKSITVDLTEQGKATELAQTVAHEVGHAKYSLEPEISASGLTRADYIQQNTARHLNDEGAANFSNARAREEILGNGGQDIGVAGAQETQYKQIYADHKAGKADEVTTSQKMGQLFGDGESTSTTGQKYNDYYGKQYADHWDSNYQSVPPGGRAP